MTLRVISIPPNLIASSDGTRDRIRAALPVEGPGQWYIMGVAANWIRGNGGHLASYGMQYENRIAAGSSDVIRFYASPRDVHSTWLWVVELRSDYDEDAGDGFEGARGTITFDPGSDARVWTLDGDTPRRFHVTHDPSSVTEGEISVTVTVDSDSPSGVYINTVSVSEIRREFLEIASGSAGVYTSSCEKGQPIYEDTDYTHKLSAQGVWENIRDARTASRRNVLFNWWDSDGITVTTTSFPGSSNLFAIDPAIQCRNTTGGGTSTRNVQWAVYGETTAAGSGEVRLSMTTGATTTITITTTTPGWFGPATFAIETDDLTASDTIRGGTRDVAVAAARLVSGTNVIVYGVSIWENT